jgi:hypothetical protein
MVTDECEGAGAKAPASLFLHLQFDAIVQNLARTSRSDAQELPRGDAENVATAAGQADGQKG